MKNLSFVLLSMTILFLASCKKDEEQLPAASDSFSAKIDAASWKATSYQASIYNGSIVIVGQASNGTSITLSIASDTAGLYGLSNSTASAASYSLGSGKGFSSASSPDAGGQVLIESINVGTREITGQFNFIGIRSSDDSTINISGGRFVKLKYSNLPLGLENNQLSAKINGNNWSPSNVSGFVAFNTLYINAIDPDGTKSLAFELPYDIGPGSYTLNYFTDYKALYISPSGAKHYAVRGNLNVSSHNLVSQEINAGFDIYLEEHEGKGVVRITVGDFEINYE